MGHPTLLGGPKGGALTGRRGDSLPKGAGHVPSPREPPAATVAPSFEICDLNSEIRFTRLRGRSDIEMS
ncbi:MAG TPA: hypothetical protein VG028_06845 [Terriglobia bacterium]|nr:hypothetical protein [Terriglobia bacterium]